MKNPKKVSIGDIMKFYKSDSEFSPGWWTDGEDKIIPPGTCGLVVGFTWVDTTEYQGYDLDLQLPDGYITKGWGEYAVEPVYKKIKSGKIWYRNKFANVIVFDK